MSRRLREREATHTTTEGGEENKNLVESRSLLLLLSGGLHEGEPDERCHDRDEEDDEHGGDGNGVLPRQEKVLRRVRRVHERLERKRAGDIETKSDAGGTAEGAGRMSGQRGAGGV